jgi:hypothetical protein
MIVRRGQAPADPEAEEKAEHYGASERLRYSDAGGLTQFGATPKRYTRGRVLPRGTGTRRRTRVFSELRPEGVLGSSPKQRSRKFGCRILHSRGPAIMRG